MEVFAAMAPHMALSSHAARRQSLRRLSASSLIFVFFLRYAIVVALLAKFGHITRSSGAANAETEIHEELISNVATELQPLPEKAIVFQDKKIICEEVAKLKAPKEDVTKNRNPRVSDSEPRGLRLYKRRESNKIGRGNREEKSLELANRSVRRTA